MLLRILVRCVRLIVYEVKLPQLLGEIVFAKKSVAPTAKTVSLFTVTITLDWININK